jgi:DNA-binding HxlR family transcriptional regulator
MKEDDRFFLDTSCRHILFVLTVNECSEPKRAMRFNELGRHLAKFGFRMSIPTLSQHLDELEKRKAIKQIVKSRNNIGYYIPLSFLKHMISARQIKKEWEKIESLQAKVKEKSLREIVSILIDLQIRHALWLTRSYLKSQFEPLLRDKASIETDLINEYFHYLFKAVASQIHDKKAEYEHVMKELDVKIKGSMV